MIYLNKKLLLKPISFVLCDFDRTISLGESTTSWGVFANSRLVSKEFKEDTDLLFQKYRPIELDHQMDQEEKNRMLAIWPNEQVGLFSKHGIDYRYYNRIINEDNQIKLRHDFANFVRNMEALNIPIYIISAGLIEPILDVLNRYNALRDNVFILANRVLTKDNNIIGLDHPIIHSFNKETINLPIDIEAYGLLFGDLPSDINMAGKLHTFNIGFAHKDNLKLYQKYFDIVLTDNSSFDQVGKILFKGYKKSKD